jgi:hypothetical protein
MILPFTRDAFLGVFTQYNAFAWPASLLAYGMALLVIIAVVRQWQSTPRLLFGALALMWAWTGVFYHMGFFTVVNTAAWGFGALFLIGAAVFAWEAGRSINPLTVVSSGWASVMAWAFVAYAMIAYPLIGIALGHRYMDLPQFGVTPCPVTLFTFGTLLLLRGPLPWRVFAVPVLWSLIGGSAAFLLDIPQDWLLLFSGGLAIAAILVSRRTQADGNLA